MRVMYWVQGLLGVILILSPYVEKFAMDRAALYTDVIIGVVIVILALIGLLFSARSPVMTRA